MPTEPHPSGVPDDERPTREVVIGQGVTWLSRWTLRWLVIVAGALVVGWVVAQTWTILLPVVLALVLTTVLQPPAQFLERQLHLPAALAAATAVVGAVAVAVGVVLFIVPSVGSQVGEIADSAADGLTEIEDWLARQGLDLTQAQIDSVVDAAQERLRSSAGSIASGVLVGVSAVTSALITLLLTLVLSFFFLKDGRRFLPWLRARTGHRVGGHLAEVGSRAWTTLGSFVRTQALVGLIDAVLIGAGLAIVGVPLVLPLAVLTFVAAFAPIVGAVTIGAVAVLVALVANGWVAALVVLAIVLLVQQLEGNVFLPWLQGRSLNLHAGVVLLTVVLGSTLFGVAGAFLGVPLVAVLAVVLRYLDDVVTGQTGQTEQTGQTGQTGQSGPDAAPGSAPDETVEGPPETSRTSEGRAPDDRQMTRE